MAQDLRAAFPDMKGFSRANLMYMRICPSEAGHGNCPTGCWTIALGPQLGAADPRERPATASGLRPERHSARVVAQYAGPITI